MLPTVPAGAITLEQFAGIGDGKQKGTYKGKGTYWCGLASGRAYPDTGPSSRDRPDLAGVAGNAQLVAHLSARALFDGGGATQMHAVAVDGGPALPFEIMGEAQPCLQAAAFSPATADGAAEGAAGATLALLNICNVSVGVAVAGFAAAGATVYSLLDEGGWASLPVEPDTFPWAGPLRPEVLSADASGRLPVSAPPLTFALWELAATTRPHQGA